MSSHVFDRAKWARMTIFEQMGNIGSEVGRTITAMQRRDTKSFDAASYRAFDLFDATIESMVEQKSPRLREVLLSRDQFAEMVLNDTPDAKLDEYFFQFALAARRDR
jgi:hypothetical protein